MIDFQLCGPWEKKFLKLKKIQMNPFVPMTYHSLPWNDYSEYLFKKFWDSSCVSCYLRMKCQMTGNKRNVQENMMTQREAINMEFIHWDINLNKNLWQCNPRMKKAWRYFYDWKQCLSNIQETCLNFLSPFPLHNVNVPPDLGGCVTCGKMKKKKKSVLIWFVQENWREIEMI